MRIFRINGYSSAYHWQIQIHIIGQWSETTLFKQFFFNWQDKDETTGPTEPYTIGKIAKVEQVPFDAAELHSNKVMAAQYGMVDDGSGKVKVWSLVKLCSCCIFAFSIVSVLLTQRCVCRFGVWKAVIKYLWIHPNMDSSLEVTVTWCCTPTVTEEERNTSSTPGECRETQTISQTVMPWTQRSPRQNNTSLSHDKININTYKHNMAHTVSKCVLKNSHVSTCTVLPSQSFGWMKYEYVMFLLP